MKTVVIATNNAHKVSEIRTALNFPGWEFQTLSEAGLASDPADDPLFLPEAYDGRLTVAEVSQAEKNGISHRGSALRHLRAILEASAAE